MLCLRNNHDRSWMRYGNRSKTLDGLPGCALSKACNYVLACEASSRSRLAPEKKRARIHFSAPIAL